ncbi:MAG TPA: ATP-binding cassette domain-containing protein [Devosiaceae bacterium]|jgi:peptide/nickel transport system ATP-binding protein
MSHILEVDNLRLAFGAVEVLHGVSLTIEPGETLGLVGESGSGKTTIGRAVLGLVAPSGGRILIDGIDRGGLNAVERRLLARKIQVVFQDPYSSLNPAMQISDILSEPLIAQGRRSREARAQVADILNRVGLPLDAGQRLPREFSGGQRQRIAIARALVIEPRLIVCDEPVSALDLSTQASILDLLIELQEQTGVAYLFISHDLAVVRHISHRVAVMRRGEIVETGPVRQVTEAPVAPYTKELLMASPVPDPRRQKERREARRRLLDGMPPITA